MGKKDKIRILVCDDSAYSRSRIKKIISDGINADFVAEAEDAIGGINAYKEHKPDLVIMDIVLRASSGFDATREILEFDSDAKIVVVTILNDNETIERIESLGVSHIINKKNVNKELPSAIESLF